MDTSCINVAECSNSPEESHSTKCRCGDPKEESHMASILPGMSDASSQFNPYCEAGSDMKNGTGSKQKSFKSVVQRHFVKDKLFSLVSDLLRSIDEEKQAQEEVLASFAQVREITEPIRKASVANAIHSTALKRRKPRSNVPLLDRIEQTRREKEKNKESSDNIEIVVTGRDSKNVSEIKIDPSEAKVKEKRINNNLCNANVDKAEPEKRVFLDDDIENNNDKQTTNKRDKAFFKRRRSISSLPGILEKCSVMKFLRNYNNIHEIDKLVLESMEENTYTPRSWSQKRTKKKKKHKKSGYDDSKDRDMPNKQCDVIIEVESHSDSDSDEDRIAIINIAESQQSADKSDKSHRDNKDVKVTNEVQISDQPDSDDDVEQSRFAMPPNRKLTVNLSNLDTIAEVSHESFSTLNGTRESSPRIYKSRHSEKREESDEEDQKIAVSSASQADESKCVLIHDDKTEFARKTSRKPSRKPTSSILKVYGTNSSKHSANSKSTRPRSKEQQRRTLTLNILDVYEENADLQKVDKAASRPRKNYRSKSAKPRLSDERRTRVKASKQQTKPMPSFYHFSTENKDEKLEEDNRFRLHRTKTSLSPRESSNSTNSLEDTESYFHALRNSQRDKLYKKPDRVLWYSLDITEGCYKLCNGSSVGDSFSGNSDKSRNSETWNVPLKEAIKNIKGAKTVPEIRELSDTVPREQRVGRLYKNLRKERSKSSRNEYRMLKTPSLEENGYYID